MLCLTLGPWLQFRSKQGVQAHLLSAGQGAAHLESAGQICSPPWQSHPGNPRGKPWKFLSQFKAEISDSCISCKAFVVAQDPIVETRTDQHEREIHMEVQGMVPQSCIY